MRQGCVLGRRLCCSVIEWALSKWRAQINGVGYNLRFADDILIFAKSFEEIGHVLDMLVDALRQVGLVLNAGKSSQPQRWEDKHFNDAEPTPSKTCVTWWDSCRDSGTKPWAQMVGLYDKQAHGWQPRTGFGTPPPSCILGFLRKQVNFV